MIQVHDEPFLIVSQLVGCRCNLYYMWLVSLGDGASGTFVKKIPLGKIVGQVDSADQTTLRTANSEIYCDDFV